MKAKKPKSEIFMVDIPMIEAGRSIKYVMAAHKPKKIKDYKPSEHDMWTNYVTGTFYVFMFGVWVIR
jgi:hypothetical protein